MELTKAYHKALIASVRKHFDGNNVIIDMEHCNDFMFLNTEAISLGRVMKRLKLVELGGRYDRDSVPTMEPNSNRRGKIGTGSKPSG
ncbi:hypothetical protein QYF36_007283 [Acer negundo]|nr:hypothetical protein QYF36_007283 [Acer negundo]